MSFSSLMDKMCCFFFSYRIIADSVCASRCIVGTYRFKSEHESNGINHLRLLRSYEAPTIECNLDLIAGVIRSKYRYCFDGDDDANILLPPILSICKYYYTSILITKQLYTKINKPSVFMRRRSSKMNLQLFDK